MKHAAAVLALTLAASVYAFACDKHPRLGNGSYGSPTADHFSYAAGASGTFVVPNGFYVTAWWAHSSGGGSVSYTPTGPRMFPACASWDAGPDPYDAAADAGPDTFDAAPPATCRATGPAIVLSAGTDYGLGIPVLTGGPDELGDGTTFVFAGTDSWLVTMAPH